VHDVHAFAMQFGRQLRTRVKRRVLQRSLHDDRLLRVTARTSRDAPARRRQTGARQRSELVRGARAVVIQREACMPAPARESIVGNHRSLARAGARPLPGRKVPFERRIAMIDVAVAVPEPSRCGLPKVDLHPCTGCDRTPAVALGYVERKSLARQRRRVDAHRPLKTRWDRIGDFVDLKRQRLAVPVDTAPAKDELILAPSDSAPAAFGHGPAFAGVAVECNVQCAMIERVATAEPTRKRIIRRKHAADEGDQRDTVVAVVAQCIDVPPGIAVLGDGAVKVRSSIRLAAAIHPDSAAIGTPGPGCALPPAR
jgi:hypothetical protein